MSGLEQNGWPQIADSLRERFQSMHEAREAGLRLCRSVIQASAKSIRHTHRRQLEAASKLVADAKLACANARAALAPYGELLYAGYLQDAQKELVEASAVLAIVQRLELPTPEELNVEPAAYLNGMGEAASELRRYVLDEMRGGRFESAGRILEDMETVYEDLIGFDFPDGMTGGLRRTTDALRAVVERTRSDLTLTQSQQELLSELQNRR